MSGNAGPSRAVWTADETDVLIYAMAASSGAACIFLSVFTVWWWAAMLPVVCVVKGVQAWRRVTRNGSGS